jgi:hypothetical protein
MKIETKSTPKKTDENPIRNNKSATCEADHKKTKKNLTKDFIGVIPNIRHGLFVKNNPILL